MSTQTKFQQPNAAIVPVEGPASANSYGLNNEQLPDRLQEALRQLVFQFSTESELSRRQEIRRIKQAHQFWRGLQYLWWNERDQNWHLPFEQKLLDKSSLEDMPRYEFVTNIYQAFGLSLVSVLSQDVPRVRFFPSSAQAEEDVAAAKAATEVAGLVERNNRIGNLIVDEAFNLWTDGKVGAYVRFVVDGQRFGFHPETEIAPREVKLGPDIYICPECAAETEAGSSGSAGVSPANLAGTEANENRRQDAGATRAGARDGRDSAAQTSSPVEARYTVPGDNAWRDAASSASPDRHRHSDRSAPVSSSVFADSANTPAHAVEESLLDVTPGNDSTTKRDPSSPSRGRTQRGENQTTRDSARDDAADWGSVEGQGFSPAANDRAKRDSSGGRSFSSDITNGREAPSLLPQAVAEGEAPERHALCSNCGALLTEENFVAAETVTVPTGQTRLRVPNGQEVVTIVGGLELKTPPWANDMHEYPYLQWNMEVHQARLRAAYPHAADKIGAPVASGMQEYERLARLAQSQGGPLTEGGDFNINLITFQRTWLRPWSFFALEDKSLRDELLQLFPDGAYCAFAGDAYCESRNENMDDHWRVLHALPGDGSSGRPALGDSLISVQERFNTLSNLQIETYEYGVPPIYADSEVLDFDSLQNQTAEPGAHYPARAKPGQSLASGFFQPEPARVPPDLAQHAANLMGPIAQFLTGAFPALFGGSMANNDTAAGYSMARDQAMGRIGLVWRRMKFFHADVMLLAVDCFRRNRPHDVEVTLLGAGAAFESKWIRLADLKGNLFSYPETDEQYPTLWSQQRAVLLQLLSNPDPQMQSILAHPENMALIKRMIGLEEFVIPDEESRTKQYREIAQLVAESPIVARTDAVSGNANLPIGAFSDAPTSPQSPGVAPHASSVIPSEARNLSSASTVGAQHAVPGANTWRDSTHPPQSPGVAPYASPVIPSEARNLSSGGRSFSSDITDGREAPSSLPQAVAEGERPQRHSVDVPGASNDAGPALELILPSIMPDEFADNHATELEICMRWFSSDAGQVAKIESPSGYANVRAHAMFHREYLLKQQRQAQQGTAIPPRVPSPRQA